MDCKFVTIVRKFKSVYERVRVYTSVGEFWRVLARRDQARCVEIWRDLTAVREYL